MVKLIIQNKVIYYQLRFYINTIIEFFRCSLQILHKSIRMDFISKIPLEYLDILRNMDPASLLCAHEYRENGCKFADLK